MAQYMLLIYEEEAPYQSDEGFAEAVKAHAAFRQSNGPALLNGNALESTSTATVVRRQAPDSFAVTDGAFAETKEVLGGYYLIEVSNLDEAIAIAKQIPAPFGGVEVRPVRAHD
jgi:hypothetical protein